MILPVNENKQATHGHRQNRTRGGLRPSLGQYQAAYETYGKRALRAIAPPLSPLTRGGRTERIEECAFLWKGFDLRGLPSPPVLRPGPHSQLRAARHASGAPPDRSRHAIAPPLATRHRAVVFTQSPRPATSTSPPSAASQLPQGGRGGGGSVLYLPGLSRYFDCFDSILEWDGMSGMEVVFDSLIFLAVLIV